ncbi:MAG: cytochrome c [Alphaproteobacteria bacterium]
MKTILAGVVTVLCVLVVDPGTAQTLRDAAAGLAIAKMHCARCHAVDTDGQSPLSIAPPFRDLHKRYPVESLEEALAEGIVTGHSDMPQFRFEPDEVESLIAFLKTLE